MEGLIPVLHLGFLTPEEISKLSHVAALIRIPFETVDDLVYEKNVGDSRGKRIKRRIKNIEWASKLKFPVRTGLVIDKSGLTKEHKEWLAYVNELQASHGFIHEVHFESFEKEDRAVLDGVSPPTKKTLLKSVATARSILSDDIELTVSLEKNPYVEELIDIGIRDFGNFSKRPSSLLSGDEFDLDDIAQRVEACGFRFQQRFPIRRRYIQEERYSKKIGQVFDAYRYKIKKEIQEKIKEAKG